MHLGRATLCRLARIGARLPLAVLTFALAVAGPPDTPAQAVFDFDDVAGEGAEAGAGAVQGTQGQVPDWLLKLTYDQWRDIRFGPSRPCGATSSCPSRCSSFIPGSTTIAPSTVNVVDAEGVHPVPFSPSHFDYGRQRLRQQGAAGPRLRRLSPALPIKSTKYYDEVIVFLGASYFRAVGKDQVFGLSARGLAIDTALPSGEEFPYFKEFWLVSPAPGAKDMAVYALLDSPSLTGAYRFVVQPGEQTVVNGRGCGCFRRKDVKKLGMAPLTSMFFYGENTLARFDDFRPEVHDSDGLLLSFDSGEWLWRPLDNPRTLQVDDFHDANPRGFGLIQRDRDFEHYQDLETHSNAAQHSGSRPRGDWGDGHVELVEIPTKSRHQRQHRGLLGAGKPAGARTSRWTLSYYISIGTETTRAPAGRSRRRRRAASTACRQTTSTASSSTSTARSSTASRPTRCCAAWSAWPRGRTRRRFSISTWSRTRSPAAGG